MQERDQQEIESLSGRIKRDRKRLLQNGHIWAGVLLLLIGVTLLVRQLTPEWYFPEWLISWQMLIIVIGLFIGVRNNFRDFGWLIMIGVGSFFLIDDIWPDTSVKKYFWPVAIIVTGLFFIFNARRIRNSTGKKSNESWFDRTGDTADTGDPSIAKEGELLDIASVFGGVKKVVFSKAFRGGEIVAVFGGAEIDMSQADFNGQVTLEIVTIFGGCTLVVPPNWEVKTEVAAVLGGIEDKRPARGSTDSGKIMMLTGTAIFGGIEIKSY